MQDTLTFLCAYCGQPNTAPLDPGEGTHACWTTDCEVCCRPLVVHVEWNDPNHPDVVVTTEGESF